MGVENRGDNRGVFLTCGRCSAAAPEEAGGGVFFNAEEFFVFAVSVGEKGIFRGGGVVGTALWSGTTKNQDVSTGPLARPFARSLAPLTRSLAPDCSLRSRPPLRSLVRSLAHFAHSLARGTVNDWMAILSVFFSIFNHSAPKSALISLPALSFRRHLHSQLD